MPGGRLRDVYVTMFKLFNLLPGQVATQKPRLLFSVLEGLKPEEEKETIPKGLDWFYGK